MQYDVRQARIYKDAYRPSAFRFFTNLLSVLLLGKSQVGNSTVLSRRIR